MNCPRCDVSLLPRRLADQDLEIPTCDGCAGMFLEHGQLDRIAEPHNGDLEFSSLDLDSFEHEDAFPRAACPRCPEISMGKVEFNIYTNIIMDHCDNCGGFWLDGKELERINDEVRRLNAADDEIPDPPMLWFARFIWSLPR